MAQNPIARTGGLRMATRRRCLLCRVVGFGGAATLPRQLRRNITGRGPFRRNTGPCSRNTGSNTMNAMGGTERWGRLSALASVPVTFPGATPQEPSPKKPVRPEGPIHHHCPDGALFISVSQLLTRNNLCRMRCVSILHLS
jgi:hypothetical protein